MALFPQILNLKTMKRLVCVIGAFFSLVQAVNAQNDDFGMWYELGAEKKLSSKWNAGVEAEFRTRNNSKTADRWSVGLNAEYKIIRSESCGGLHVPL